MNDWLSALARRAATLVTPSEEDDGYRPRQTDRAVRGYSFPERRRTCPHCSAPIFAETVVCRRCRNPVYSDGVADAAADGDATTARGMPGKGAAPAEAPSNPAFAWLDTAFARMSGPTADPEAAHKPTVWDGGAASPPAPIEQSGDVPEAAKPEIAPPPRRSRQPRPASATPRDAMEPPPPENVLPGTHGKINLEIPAPLGFPVAPRVVAGGVVAALALVVGWLVLPQMFDTPKPDIERALARVVESEPVIPPPVAPSAVPTRPARPSLELTTERTDLTGDRSALPDFKIVFTPPPPPPPLPPPVPEVASVPTVAAPPSPPSPVSPSIHPAAELSALEATLDVAKAETQRPAENIPQKPAENIPQKPAENIPQKPAESIPQKKEEKPAAPPPVRAASVAPPTFPVSPASPAAPMLKSRKDDVAAPKDDAVSLALVAPARKPPAPPAAKSDVASAPLPAKPRAKVEDRTATPAESRPVAPAESAPAYRDEIAAVQQALTRLGYETGPVDGRAGGKTTNAIRSFQRTRGLEPTGTVDPVLLRRLGISVPVGPATTTQSAAKPNAQPQRPSPRVSGAGASASAGTASSHVPLSAPVIVIPGGAKSAVVVAAPAATRSGNSNDAGGGSGSGAGGASSSGGASAGSSGAGGSAGGSASGGTGAAGGSSGGSGGGSAGGSGGGGSGGSGSGGSGSSGSGGSGNSGGPAGGAAGAAGGAAGAAGAAAGAAGAAGAAAGAAGAAAGGAGGGGGGGGGGEGASR